MAMSCFATARESAKYKRDFPPAHYLLKIESFKVLSTSDKYDSGEFEVGNHKWRLSLYPKGNKNDNGSGYISLYLSIEDRPLNETVYVNYKLFVHDKSRNKYLTIQELYQFVEIPVDADKPISSFDGSKTQYGFPRFLSLKEFKKRSNGYLDEKYSCTFGAEVFVIHPAKGRKEESFTLIKYPKTNTFTLKIENWSTLGTDPQYIDFLFEERNWKLMAYPRVNGASKGKSLSVYLKVEGPIVGQVYADFNLRVLDQLKGKHKEKQFECWLSASHPQGGNEDFMPLKDLEKSANGFVQNDTLVVEVQIRVVSKLKPGVVPSQP